MELLLQLLSVLLALLSRSREVFYGLPPDRALFHSFDANQRRRSLVASGRAAVPAAEGREGAQEPSFRAKAVDEEISQQPCARVLMFLLYIIWREGITTAPFLLHKCAFVPHLGLGFL